MFLADKLIHTAYKFLDTGCMVKHIIYADGVWADRKNILAVPRGGDRAGLYEVKTRESSVTDSLPSFSG